MAASAYPAAGRLHWGWNWARMTLWWVRHACRPSVGSRSADQVVNQDQAGTGLSDGDSARYLGIDVGSTATKAIALTADGRSLVSGSTPYPTSRPAHDRAEQDAQSWINAVDESVAQIAAKIDLSTVRGIGVTSQVDTHVPVDSDLRPLSAAMLWQDVRSAGEARTLNERLGKHGRVLGWGGPGLIDASNPVPRALWLARHEPATWHRCRWLLLPKDLVNAWLTGQVATDPQAWFKVVGTSGSYVPGISYAEGLAARLPPLRAPEQAIGTTSRAWHGVPKGTTVATATMDGFGNVLGSGLYKPGDTMLILGTSIIVATIGVGVRDGQGVVNFAPFRGRQVHAGPTQSGADSLRWWAQATGHSIEEVLSAAEKAPSGSDGVVFAPHLVGERAPLWDDQVRAWFTGMHAGIGFAELSRAVLEGVAYSARELLAVIEDASTVRARHLVVSGGGSRSAFWCQVLADVTGRTIHRSAEPNTAVIGAATLAASAHTGSDPWSLAATRTHRDLVCEPDPLHCLRHDRLFAIYRAAYDRLGPVHQMLGEFHTAIEHA